jgi:hypothetical protein
MGALNFLRFGVLRLVCLGGPGSPRDLPKKWGAVPPPSPLFGQPRDRPGPRNDRFAILKEFRPSQHTANASIKEYCPAPGFDVLRRCPAARTATTDDSRLFWARGREVQTSRPGPGPEGGPDLTARARPGGRSRPHGPGPVSGLVCVSVLSQITGATRWTGPRNMTPPNPPPHPRHWQHQQGSRLRLLGQLSIGRFSQRSSVFNP